MPQLSYLWYTIKQNDTITIMVIRHAPVVLPLVCSQAERYNNNHGYTTCHSCLTSGIQSGRTIQEQSWLYDMPQLSYLWYTVKQNDTITIMVIRHAPVVLPLVYSQAERYNNNHGYTTCPSCLTSGIQSSTTIQ